MKKIDAHAHIGYVGGWANVGITAEGLIQNMDDYQVCQTLLCAVDNEAVKIAVDQYPDRLIGLAYPNPWDGQKAVDLVHHYVEDYGFRGIKLNPLRQAFVADDPLVYPLMEAAQELSLPVFIHCGHPPYSLPWSIAFLAERFPQVKVVMLHMGHGHGVYIQASIAMAQRFANLYLEISGMPMPSKIKEAYETVGAHRVMYGTDTPFHHPSVEIQKVLTSGLPPEAQEDVFYNNAARLMGLKL